jgi:hypothetical protein
MPRSFAVWPTTSLLLLAASQFASPAREDDKFWDRFFDAVLGPYGRPHQSLLELHHFQTAYGMDPGGVSVGLAKAYPETDRVGGACMRAQSTAPSARAATDTRDTRRQLVSIGYQAVCRLPPSASASTFALDGTVLTTYTAGQLAVVSFTCILSNQCMQSFTRDGPSVPTVRSCTRYPPCVIAVVWNKSLYFWQHKIKVSLLLSFVTRTTGSHTSRGRGALLRLCRLGKDTRFLSSHYYNTE